MVLPWHVLGVSWIRGFYRHAGVTRMLEPCLLPTMPGANPARRTPLIMLKEPGRSQGRIKCLRSFDVPLNHGSRCSSSAHRWWGPSLLPERSWTRNILPFHGLWIGWLPLSAPRGESLLRTRRTRQAGEARQHVGERESREGDPNDSFGQSGETASRCPARSRKG